MRDKIKLMVSQKYALESGKTMKIALFERTEINLIQTNLTLTLSAPTCKDNPLNSLHISITSGTKHFLVTLDIVVPKMNNCNFIHFAKYSITHRSSCKLT